MPPRYIAFLALALIVAAAVVFPAKIRHVRRARAHVRGENAARVSGLQTWLSFAAARAPEIFVNSVGTGMVTEATTLPQGLLTNFPFEVTPDEIGWNLKDTWGHPLHVALIRVASSQAGNRYQLSVWSSGPNGSNEMKGGDDIVSEKISIECP